MFTTDRRLELQALLETFAENVYFQPPTGMLMEFPAIVYERAPANTRFAGNLPYSIQNQYLLTIIDRDPESAIIPKVRELPMCAHSRSFKADNLNHDVYTLYF